jgi:hypothetical protein
MTDTFSNGNQWIEFATNTNTFETKTGNWSGFNQSWTTGLHREGEIAIEPLEFECNVCGEVQNAMICTVCADAVQRYREYLIMQELKELCD